LNIGGTGGLTTKARADRNHGGDLADIYTFKQSIAATRFMNVILAMHPNLIDAFYRFVASGSTSEPEIFWQVAPVRYSASRFLEWSTVQTSLTTTGQRLAIWGDLVRPHHR
jgi:hypothetical protein